ncbi:MAG TPA: 1-(5-phosphoribosyl)-5-[(5-phosphoribosylamino)methylideneamino]imidazole-4-carboxamide isomerase [Solirubrobacteraceae bacterium]|nr:1-(5-phosphoribosyl)-5-[(5-phosphoribosylamino)methylideneamino]imidazole-4-carboxamide isomerase [Solirubrobacteraceae bacterium]
MILYPAIDILDGRAVRLTKGDFDAQTVYDEHPLAAARGWVEQGATHLHVVDLDGAKAGAPVNLEHLRRIARDSGVPVQFGGGLRATGSIERAFEAGAARVILGTAAFSDPDLLDHALTAWPERVLVSVDVRGGRVATRGWTDTVDGAPATVIARLLERGANRLVYTNVDRDGMLQGPDLDEVRAVAEAARAEARAGSLIYSGGIGQLDDLRNLAGLGSPALDGVIVGKALYERRFTVAQALEALAG